MSWTSRDVEVMAKAAVPKVFSVCFACWWSLFKAVVLSLL